MARALGIMAMLLVAGAAYAQVPASCPSGQIPIGQGANHALKCGPIAPLLPTQTQTPTPTSTATQTQTATPAPTHTPTATPGACAAGWVSGWGLPFSFTCTTPVPTPTAATQYFNYPFSDYGSLDVTNKYSCTFAVSSKTVQKATLSVGHFQCAVNPALIIADCGTTVNTCPAPTAISTYNPTAVGVYNAGIANAALPANHYICGYATAGTCNDLDWTYTLNGTIP